MSKKDQGESDLEVSGVPRHSRFQKFEVQRVHRSQINPAPYNPRKIDPYAKKKLANSLKTFGLVEPIIWNRRTGVLVGGHQRLAAMDDKERDPNYTIDVSVVDLDEKAERELNVALNNPALQGQYDEDSLAALVRSAEGFSLENAGFDPMDLQVILDAPENDKLFAMQHQNASTQEAVAGASELTEERVAERQQKEAEKAAKKAEQIEQIRQRKKEWKEKDRSENDPEFIAVFVFKDREEQTEAVTALGADPNAREVDGMLLLRALGLRP